MRSGRVPDCGLQEDGEFPAYGWPVWMWRVFSQRRFTFAKRLATPGWQGGGLRLQPLYTTGSSAAARRTPPRCAPRRACAGTATPEVMASELP